MSLTNDYDFGKSLTNSFNVTGAIVAPQSELPESVAQKEYVDTADAVLQQQVTFAQDDINGFDDELKNLDTAEVLQLQNIGTNTISNLQWSYLGTMDQSLSTLDNATFEDLNVANVFPSGTVDGRDIATDGNKLDNLDTAIRTTIGLDRLTFDEVTQLTNINTNTISNTQWGYLGNLNQPLTTTDNVRFNELRITMDSGFDTAISGAGMCIRGDTSGSTCLLDVFETGSRFASNVDGTFVDINNLGLTVPNNRDFIITGGVTLKGVNSQVSTNTGNISTNTTNISNNASAISTNTGNISTNATNISNNTSAIAGKLNGVTGTDLVIAGSASLTNATTGFYACEAGNQPTLPIGSRNVIISGNITGSVFSGSDNVYLGSTSTVSSIGQNNCTIGYGNSVSSGIPNNTVILGSNNSLQDSNQNCVVIGEGLQSEGDNNVIIGKDSNVSGGTGSNTAVGSNAIVTGNANTCIGAFSSVIGNFGTAIGYTNYVAGESLALGANNVVGFTGAVNQTLTFGNSITSNVANAVVFGNNITNTVPGVIWKSVYETSGTGNTAVFESIAGGLVKLSSIVSSRRHKTDIKNITDYKTEDIYKIEGKQFRMKDKELLQVGVIAEDMLGKGALLESMIVWKEDDEGVDESEPRDQFGRVVKSFRYQDLIIPMIEEMKKLKEQNDKLIKQVNKLGALFKEHIKNCNV